MPRRRWPVDETAKVDNPIASLGGKAAAAKMTPAERSERARRAAVTRWSAGVPRTEHEGELKIGDAVISCAVLAGGVRVISQRSMSVALGRHVTGSGSSKSKGQQDPTGDGVAKLPSFLGAANLKPFIDEELTASLTEPLLYFPMHAGRTAYGFRAELFPKICDVWVRANHAGVLTKSQAQSAEKAYLLMRALAHVGIIGLVDEATGYQYARERDALAKILEAFIAQELRPYVRAFEPDYYRAICDLKGWEFKTSSRRPRALAHITNDLVYARLAPGVLDELRRKNPVVKNGRRGAKHFQWLTENKGHQELQKHLARITGWAQMAKASGMTWGAFYQFVEKQKPKYRGPTLFDGIGDEAE
jgi:hypothetical protein